MTTKLVHVLRDGYRVQQGWRRLPKSTGKASEMIKDTANKAITAIFERLLSSDFFVSDIEVFIFLDECGGTAPNL